MKIQKPDDLTPSQWHTVQSFYAYLLEFKITPNNKDLSDFMGNSSANTTFQVIKILEEKGYIGVVKNVSRGMYLTDKSLEILEN